MNKRMEWASLLDTGRHGASSDTGRPERQNYTQDADRISFSAPFRLLANKTQVHPLYENDHLRHRLIHSLEVASVGRTLGAQLGQWLCDEGYAPEDAMHSVSGIVHAACLAHDIGNPPFGHSGESSIGEWFAEKFDAPVGVFRGIDFAKQAEFKRFEGNAQGFRILSNLEMYRGQGGMCLSHAVLGAFMKYPMSAGTSEAIAKTADSKPYVGAKKFGFFEAERAQFASAAGSLGLLQEIGPDKLSWWRRHPLVFLVEAADDICYNIVDLEDGFSAGDLSFKTVIDLLLPLAGNTNRDISRYTDYEQITYLRSRAIGGAIIACLDAFKANYDTIMSGQFSGDLVEASELGREFAAIKEIASERLFKAERKTNLEIRGRNIVRSVLDGILPVYDTLAVNDWQRGALSSYQDQLVRALNLEVRDIYNNYDALHAIADRVSGMTDRYAVEVSKMLSGT